MEPITSSTIRVLLVDDQAMIGEAVRRHLSSEKDIQFYFCSDPAQALPKAKEIIPSVILQDLVLPNTDGLTLVRQFRADPGLDKTPIIVLSGKDDPETRAQSVVAGASDFLMKLPSKGVLIATIRKHAMLVPPSTSSPANPVAPAEKSDEIVDSVRLRELTDGNPEVLQEIINLYLSETSRLLQELSVAVEKKDSKQVEMLAHTMRGSSLSCGVNLMGKAFEHLEEMGHRNETSKFADTYQLICHEFTVARQQLNQHLKTVNSTDSQ